MAYYGNAIYDTSQPVPGSGPGSMDQAWMQQQQQPAMYHGDVMQVSIKQIWPQV